MSDDRNPSPTAVRRRPGLARSGIALRRALQRAASSPERMRTVQADALREAVQHAARNVPLYRELLGDNVEICTVDDVRALPVVDRAMLAAAPVASRRGTAVDDGTLVKRTSGSSGEYLVVERNAHAAWWQGILEQRRNRTRGLQPWSSTAAVRVDPDRRSTRGLLGAASRRAVVLDAGEHPIALAAAIERLRPDAVSGFGHLLIDIGRQLDGRIRPRMLGTGGQVLSDADRRSLQEWWHTPPLDLYGAVEVGSIAWQCRAADLYHVDHDSVLVEILDDDRRPCGPGRPGHVVVTSLVDRHMPVVRYRLGDVARWADRPCACGHRLPALSVVEGREMDRFVDSTGTAIASTRLFLSAQHSDALRHVGRYRVLQRADRSVTIEIVPAGQLPPAVAGAIVDGYRMVLGAGIAVELRTVDSIPLDPSGKFRQFESVAAGATC